MFVCSIEDDSHHAATVWSGTAFNCSSDMSITNNKIYLAHLPHSSYAYGSCGALSAESVGVNNSLYTSTLTVMPGSLEAPNGKTIDCSLSGGTIFGSVIFRVGGEVVVMLKCMSIIFVYLYTVVPEPPVGNGLSFSVEAPHIFTVSWAGVSGGVGGFLVNVSSECGQCINIVSANVTDMSCSGWEPIGQTCNISVYTVTAYCHVQSEVPLLFAVYLKCECIIMYIHFRVHVYRFTVLSIYIAVPEIPNIIAIIATYKLSGNLKRITTTLSKKQVRKA